MLQIPSSTFSISKGLVGLLGGFCIGAQLAVSIALSGLSVPKIQDSVVATQTTKLGLLPTKCVLSNGTVSFPYVAAMGYATLIFASLVCILRAKGFFSQPPSSPPPELTASCSTDKVPRRNKWLWILLVLFFLVVMFVGGIYTFFYFTCPDSPTAMSAFTSFWVQSLSAVERHLYRGCIAGAAYISTVKTYISMHGFRYSKLLVLVFTSHFVCVHIVKAVARFPVRARLARFHPLMVHPTVIWAFVVPPIAIVSCSKLSWIFWMPYYYHDKCTTPLAVSIYRSGRFLWVLPYLAPLAKITRQEILMITGPILVHTCLVISAVLSRVSSAVIDLLRRLSYPPHLCIFVLHCLWNIASVANPVLLMCAIMEYYFLPPDGKELIWKVYSCQRSRDSLRIMFGLAVQKYRDWKSGQLAKLQPLVWNLLVAAFDSSLETWNHLPLIQKLASRSVLVLLLPLLIEIDPLAYNSSCGHILWLVSYSPGKIQKSSRIIAELATTMNLYLLLARLGRESTSGPRYNGDSMTRRGGQGGALSEPQDSGDFTNGGHA